jgi:AbiV family abortive infection protein
MNRTDLQNLAELRIREAKILLDAGSYPGAFYLAGYSIECALKACIAKATRQHDFPDKKRTQDSYSHDLMQLLSLTDLKNQLQDDMKSNRDLRAYWNRVVNWNEERRYELGLTEQEAKDLYQAIADPLNGVLSWLKKCW